jgi:general secretion pathway protein D
LLTLDNQEAEILVGQNVPFITGQGVDLASVANVFTTVERQDIGIKLKIRPQVSEGDVVILEVEEEVSALVQNALLDAAAVGPTTTVRSARTTVAVADGRTVVIGGLISNSIAQRESKVPILGDIPFLGRLFRVDADAQEKVNLLVILTPHIIRTKSDMSIVSERKRERYQEGLPPAKIPLPAFSVDAAPPAQPNPAPETQPTHDAVVPHDPGARYILPSNRPRGS